MRDTIQNRRIETLGIRIFHRAKVFQAEIQLHRGPCGSGVTTTERKEAPDTNANRKRSWCQIPQREVAFGGIVPAGLHGIYRALYTGPTE